ncbi:MAG: flagellar hook-associated protein FlgK [Alphaproteobacteria bacterium]|nr:flagellar hook-associated protein FlgK [Alphaproteobacteria bacterium]
MGLASLDAALSGLRISQQQISVISNNVANVSTPGFTRKILPQSTQAVNGVSIGVTGETIIRQVDLSLERDLWTQVSAVGYLDIQQTYLNRIQKFHGPPDKELSVAAEISRLRDSFSALADSPEDPFLLAGTVDQATDTANKINNLSALITQLRNDAQDELAITVERANDLLVQIANLNDQVSVNLSVGRSAALMQDKRDEAIKELAGLIDISFFTRGDGVLVVQTSEGVELASDKAERLTFRPTSQSATTYYPVSANGIFVGDPVTNPAAIDITQRSPGGKIGGLLALRDTTFPKQMAQLDELAHKLALRFEAQGLRLFTDASGTIPPDTPPDPTTVPSPTPVSYTGFSARIQVNASILADHNVLRTGTYGANVAAGSNEVIRRIVEFAFQDINYQQATGDIDLRVSANAPPNNTLQNYLGLFSENRVAGTVDLTAYTGVADIIAAGGPAVFGTAPNETDRFTITFSDPDLAGGPYSVSLDLRTIVPSGVSAAQDLVDAIQADANWANIQADFNGAVSIGPNGELLLESRSDITIAAAGAEPLSSTGFAFLGLSPATYEATDPSFNIQVGNNPSVKVTIGPGDDETDLLSQLAGVPGLAVDTDAFLPAEDGFLRLRPGNDFLDPDFGGDIRIVGGPFESDPALAGEPSIAALGAGNGINIVSALFGSFNAGPPAQDFSPVADTGYASETNGALGPPVPTLSFRETLLGPGANISTRVNGALTLVDFAQKMVNEHAQEVLLVESRAADEDSLREVLQDQLLSESGVNLDEELGHLVVVQTAYSAAARVINAVDELFKELLDAVR